MVRKKCKQCKEEFSSYGSRNRKFCSRECYNKHRNVGRIKKKCKKCGKEFYVKYSRKDKAKFCSQNCYKIYWKKEKYCRHFKKHTKETKRNIRVALNKLYQSGKKVAWNKGKKMPSITGENSHFWKGGKIIKKCKYCNQEFKSFPSDNRIYCSLICNWKGIVGLRVREKHHNWKHNRKLKEHIREGFKYINWRNSIFKRDNYTCQECGIRSGNGKKVILNAHHVKPFYKIIDENNISTLEEADKCNELWDLNNGLTLCQQCHIKTDNFGGNA